MTEIQNFKRGMKDGIPIFLGYLSVSFAFGIFSVNEGLSILEAVLVSMTNLTSAGQLAGVPIICALGSCAELALTQVVINLRYALMSISLSQKLDKSVKLRERFLIAFGNTDEIFAVAIGNKNDVTTPYMLGLILLPFIGWTTGTLLGSVAGNILPAIITSALGVAIYGMFVAIVFPPARENRNTAFCVLFAIALSCLFNFVSPLNEISGGFILIICAVTASILFAIIAPIKEEKTEEEATEDNG